MANAQLDARATLAEKNILLTGTTGFVGKVVLCLLLDSFSEIGKIFALIRPGIQARSAERFASKVLSSPALKPLRDRHGADFERFVMSKVQPIDGNVIRPDCGLDPETIAALVREGVYVIINSAGLVDFDPPVDQALSINAFGVSHMVGLAKRLDAPLVHVSTCYVNGSRAGQVMEAEDPFGYVPAAKSLKVNSFDPAAEIQRLSEMAAAVRQEAVDPRQLAQFQAAAHTALQRDGRDPSDARALKTGSTRAKKEWVAARLREIGMERAGFWGWQNTYTFTKSLGEQLISAAVRDEGLRATIVRPAVVESATSFPFPGWNEGFTTTAPLILVARRGVMSFPHAEDLVLDVIPVDMVCSTIIAATVAVLCDEHKLIYQAASGAVNPLTVAKAIEFVGFGVRAHAREKDRGGALGWLLQRHQWQAVSEQRYRRLGAPKQRKLAAKVRDMAMDIGPERFGWLRRVATRVDKVAEDVESKTSKLEELLELFMPFVAGAKHIFRSDHVRELHDRLKDGESQNLVFSPEQIVWRDYFTKVHLQGLEKWVFPKLEAELEEPTKRSYVHRNLSELFAEATHRHRHRLALRYLRDGQTEELTYGDLRLLAGRVAAFLDSLGVSPGDRVAVCGENRPEWVAVYFGIIWVGATAVPIDSGSAAAEIVNVCSAAQARALLVTPSRDVRLRKTTNGEKCSDAMSRLAESGTELASFEAALRHQSVLENYRDPARLASIIFTSGTTGDPKGVMLTHRNFTFEVSRLGGIFSIDDSDHLLSVLPLHHTFEFTAGLLLPVSRGARITYLEELTAESLSGALAGGVTALIGVPALWELLQRRISGRFNDKSPLLGLALSGVQKFNSFARQQFGVNVGPLTAMPVHRALGGRLRYLVSGGAAIGEDTVEFFRSLGFNLTEGYGLTETAPVLTVTDPKADFVPGSVGKPLSGVEIRIDSPDERGVGEVLARGPNVMQGYWQDEEATNEAIVDGWFHTGDLGYQDGDGHLHLVGRQKDVIVDRDGRNVYPDELEELYGEHSSIEELSIVGITQAGGAERVAALVRLAEGGSDDDVAIHFRDVGQSLPLYKRVKILHFTTSELPRTATKKVRRPKVREHLAALEERHQRALRQNSPKASPQISGKAALNAVLEAVAKVSGQPVGSVSESKRLAADLGFDSLMAVELHGALEADLNIALAAESMAAIDTVGQLVDEVTKQRGRLSVSSRPGGAGGQRMAQAASQGGAGADERSGGDDLELPEVLSSLGKSAFGWGQKQLFERVLDATVHGREYIPRTGNFIAIANHQSS